MAVLTQAQIQQYAQQALDTFQSGIHLGDIPQLVGTLMEIVEQVQGMSGADKKQSVIAMVDYVLENVDIPWAPKAFVVPMLEPLVPAMIDKLVDATTGGLNVNVAPPPVPTPAPAPAPATPTATPPATPTT
jgi:hypothetical protein